MAQSINTFLKGKLNKDLDARLLPNGEYRDAKNIQVSKSEGPNVGSLENVLGNELALNFKTLTGVSNLRCIGYLTSEVDECIFLFLTDYDDPKPQFLTYYNQANNFIIKYKVGTSVSTSSSTILVQGAFLNFSQSHPIYGVNLLETLLFFTDNRNQPRVINVQKAEEIGVNHYTTEDQISVAKYNPYNPIYLWDKNAGSSASVPFETTMKDVTSKFMPNGGSAFCRGAHSGGTSIDIDNIKGDILQAGLGVTNPYQALGATVSYINNNGEIVSTGTTVNTYNSATGVLTTVASVAALGDNTELVFNANPFYDKNFAGDEDYLEDKFVRFSYRFKFEDGEYSLMAPFTQAAFIPKQDGYFMYVKHDNTGTYPIPTKDDQTDSFRSTVVSFMENKTDEITLKVPLPFAANTLESSLKVTELELLYKESDGLAVKVIDTVTISEIATASVGKDYYDYKYLSKKPFKTLPDDEIIRVFDQTPVRALSQEISGNRVIYGNFQNKHTPLESIDYNVAASPKDDFDLKTGTATGAAGNYNANATVNISSVTGTIQIGSIVTGPSGSTIPANTQVTGGNFSSTVTFNKAIVLTALGGSALVFNPIGPDTQNVTKVEYPNSSLKQNRNYQVGVVLSDRYGRQSSVILSNNDTISAVGGSSFVGDTIYSAYNTEGVQQENWPGDSLKVLFNQPLAPSSKNMVTKWPGLYNGDTTDKNYNPLGWYSYKIVVKQTEQEYYNVYLPGIMASYPEDQTLELGGTSFVSLINDNINKVPRDLTELGPEQRQFRSSVQLFGRVENTSTAVTYSGVDIQNIGLTNTPYYPGKSSDTVSTVSTIDDLFAYNASNPPRPNYFPQFYALDSNPLIAKISTEAQIGQIATTNFDTASALTNAAVNDASSFVLKNVIGNITPGDFVSGIGVPEGVFVTAFNSGTSTVQIVDSSNNPYNITLPVDAVLFFSPGFANPNLGNLKRPGVQYLAVYETEAVDSLLDIFWETTSAGLISDLNNLIINSAEGAAGLSSFNTSPWDEFTGGMNFAAEDILQSDFTLVDSFGVDIPNSDIDSVTLESAVDANGVDRQLASNGGPYFTLTNPNPGDFNIQITQNYWNNVFFGDNANVRLFTFKINTTTSVNGNISSNSFFESAGPDNMPPQRGTQISPGTAGTESPTSGSTVYTNRTITTTQATCDFVNGAANVNLRTNDLDISLAAVDSDGTDVTSNNYFSLNTAIVTGTLVKNIQATVAIQNSSMPIDIYTLTVTGTDSGISPVANYVVNIDVRENVSYAEQVFRCVTGEYDCGGYSVLVMAVSTSGISNNRGWYAYVGAINSLADGTNVTLDKTNAYTSAQSAYGSYAGNFFFFQQNTPDQTGLNTLLGYVSGSLDDYWLGNIDGAGTPGWCYNYGTGSNPSPCGCDGLGCNDPFLVSVSNYNFEIV
jgi:hypothetical protein|tara:strand:- start:15311 stop:19567 length:4257 start_codon:yes stop_codon:yes gene_type:complete